MGFLTVFGMRTPRVIRKRLSSRILRVSQCNTFSSDVSDHKEDDVLYDLIISGGGMVGCAMAAALGVCDGMPLFYCVSLL